MPQWLVDGSGWPGIGPGGGAASRTTDPVGGIVGGSDNECDEQALDLVAGERNEGIGYGTGVLVCAYDGEKGVREHARETRRDQEA